MDPRYQFGNNPSRYYASTRNRSSSYNQPLVSTNTTNPKSKIVLVVAIVAFIGIIIGLIAWGVQRKRHPTLKTPPPTTFFPQTTTSVPLFNT